MYPNRHGRFRGTAVAVKRVMATRRPRQGNASTNQADFSVLSNEGGRSSTRHSNARMRGNAEQRGIRRIRNAFTEAADAKGMVETNGSGSESRRGALLPSIASTQNQRRPWYAFWYHCLPQSTKRHWEEKRLRENFVAGQLLPSHWLLTSSKAYVGDRDANAKQAPAP